MTFDELIIELDSGSFNAELTAHLRDVLAACNARVQHDGGTAKGELALTLAFVAAANGRVEITASAKAKSPGPRKVTETRWVTGRGELAAADPRQAALPLKVPGKHAGVGGFDHADKAGE